MENASKALLIAGAILLAILLISLGIIVFNRAKGTVTDANLDQETAQAFNTKLIQYCGNNKSADDMNNLMNALMSLNGSQKEKGNAKYVDMVLASDTFGSVDKNGKSGSGDLTYSGKSTTAYPIFYNSIRYKAIYENDASGYINKIKIYKN